jgi:hypothetical protein
VKKYFGEKIVEVLEKEGERTVGILHGEFMKSREPSDLTKEQGSYREYF